MSEDTRRKSSSPKRRRSTSDGVPRTGKSRTSGTRSGSSASRRSSSGHISPGTARNRKRKGKRAAARKRRRMILFGVEAVVILCLIVVLVVVSKLDRMQGGDLSNSQAAGTTDESLDNVDPVVDITPETEAKLEGYTNIALFGVDSRTGILGSGSRSDTIIIASINNQTKDVKLCSVYRDTYLNLTNGSYGKANGAYAFGGPEQAISMLNLNLDLNITEYVSVDFTAIANVVDALGGIEIDVTEEEMGHLNNYTVETSEVVGRSTTKLTSPGLQTLDGIQAVSYCRIRYTAGDDFKRTERQRDVIEKIVEKAKTADIATINEIIDEVFSQVATNMSATEVLSMASDILSYNIVGSDGFPFDRATGTFGSKGSCVVAADLEHNVVQLHSYLFGEDESYVVSDNVKEISEKIVSDTNVTAPEEE